jgi:1-aminocyclopropane-1-carboxylate deaminase
MHSFSAVTPLRFRGRDYYIKRDDTIHDLLSGNKYRKLFSLLQLPNSHYYHLISYGGTQSNAMLSIAYLAHSKGWMFTYYCKTLPLHVKQNPCGNLARSLELGMKIIEIPPEDFEMEISKLFFRLNERELLIPQGGADPIAEEGVKVLAQEIEMFKKEQGIEHLNLATPSGTGTTAYYLAKHYKGNVYTTACVGDSSYLKKQMQALGVLPSNLHLLTTSKRYRFGTPYQEFLKINQELENAGIIFDLLYAPPMWQALDEHKNFIEKIPMLYVHSGGVIGNESMMERYRYKKMI